jgi:hypothetical protein
VSEEKKEGLTEDMVRKLLQMNPQLRGEGKTTRDVLSSVLGAKPSTEPKPVKSEATVDGVVARMARDLDAWTLAHKRERDIAAKQAKDLNDELNRITALACERMIEAVLAEDPGLVDPQNVALLEKEKAFLAHIGFSISKVLAAKHKRGL